MLVFLGKMGNRVIGIVNGNEPRFVRHDATTTFVSLLGSYLKEEGVFLAQPADEIHQGIPKLVDPQKTIEIHLSETPNLIELSFFIVYHIQYGNALRISKDY